MLEVFARSTRPYGGLRALAVLPLVAAVFALLALPAAAMPSAFAVVLTDAGVSTVDATSPQTPPVVVAPGGQFRAWYRVTNPYDQPVDVTLGAEISSYGMKIQDAAGAGGIVCSVPAQSSIMCSRLFTLRSNVGPGYYMVHFGIGIAIGSKYSLGASYVQHDNWVLVQASAAPAATPLPPPAPTGPGRYFPQTLLWVRDGVPLPDGSGKVASFLSEFDRLGGVAALGYPASRPYWKDGFFYQVFQRAILQWRPEQTPPQAVLVNTLDWMQAGGKDDFLFAKGIPRHVTTPDGAGGDFERAKQIRFEWMTDPAIREAYFANPNPDRISAWDPVTFYGLPTSRPERHGAFTTQRFQRYVFQKWEQAVAGMPSPGTVVGVLAGDLFKEAGLVPGPAVQTETP